MLEIHLSKPSTLMPIFRISVGLELYSGGMIMLFVSGPTINQLAKELDAQQVFGKIVHIGLSLAISQSRHARQLVMFLKDKGYICDEDYPALISAVKEVEKVFAAATDSIAESVTTGQIEQFESIIIDCIDEIVEATGSYESTTSVFVSALSAHDFGYGILPPAIVLRSLRNAGISDTDQLKRITDAGLQLHKIFLGRAGLESTFQRIESTNKLPSLKLQRSMTIDLMLKQLFAKYSLDPWQRFYAALNCELWANSLPHSGDLAEIKLENAAETFSELVSGHLSERTKRAMSAKDTMPGGQKALYERTINRIKYTILELDVLMKTDNTLLKSVFSEQKKRLQVLQMSPRTKRITEHSAPFFLNEKSTLTPKWQTHPQDTNMKFMLFKPESVKDADAFQSFLVTKGFDVERSVTPKGNLAVTVKLTQ